MTEEKENEVVVGNFELMLCFLWHQGAQQLRQNDKLSVMELAIVSMFGEAGTLMFSSDTHLSDGV